MPGERDSSDRSMRRTLSVREVGDVFEDAVDEVGMRVYDDDGVSVPALGLLPHLVTAMWCMRVDLPMRVCGRRRGGGA